MYRVEIMPCRSEITEPDLIPTFEIELRREGLKHRLYLTSLDRLLSTTIRLAISRGLLGSGRSCLARGGTP